MRRMWKGSWSKHLLLLPVVVLAVIPFVMKMPSGQTEMQGTDSMAQESLEKDAPQFKPWFSPLWVPPGSQMESLLFSLQASLGGLALGYILGRLRR